MLVRLIRLRLTIIVVTVLLLIRPAVRAERINQEGRILGPLPVVTNAILFNTSAADAVVSALQIFPVTNPWNERITNRPVLSYSDAMIAQIGSDLDPSRQNLRAFYEMNYVMVPDSQPAIPISFVEYGNESDPSPYPIPTNMPVETWPHETGSLTLSEWQATDVDEDRHSIVVQPGTGYIWETWKTLRTGANWEASNGAKFNLNTNGLRRAGWTSADAAGLPMFPALVRFDECERGMVEHACRIVVKRTLYQKYIYPATHYASASTNTITNLPSMGQRLRLKSSYNISTNWTKQEKAVLLGLKKYGALVADNGNFFSISVTPDDRWPANCFNHLSSVGITNFEVIQATGTNEGPRSAGAPVAIAGADQVAPVNVPWALQGSVGATAPGTVVQWRLYSGPGAVVFGNAAQTNTTATFGAAGMYTLMLSADDGAHAVAYDAVVITALNGVVLSATRTGTNTLNLSWTGGTPPFVVERSSVVAPVSWMGALTTSAQVATVPLVGDGGIFRVKSN